MKVFLSILLLSFIEFFGDSSLKLYARNSKLVYLFSGIIIYLILVVGLIYILKYSNVAYANLLWDGTSAIIETALAFILLKETLSNNVQYAGAIAIIAGMIMLNIGKVPIN